MGRLRFGAVRSAVGDEGIVAGQGESWLAEARRNCRSGVSFISTRFDPRRGARYRLQLSAVVGVMIEMIVTCNTPLELSDVCFE